MKRSLLFLCMIPLATFSAWAQALQPDPDPQFTDSCGRTSQIGNEGPVSYETFMTSAISLDPLNQNVTLPLHKGYVGTVNDTSTPVYYILTDTSDCTEAIHNKINYVPKLANLLPTLTGPGPYPLQVVQVDKNGYIHFPASATFNASSRVFVPGANGWPPNASMPGSIGAPNYSPYITYVNSAGKQVVFNASHVADAMGNSKNFATVDLKKMTATLTMVKGIYDFNFVMYLRMDATNCGISGFEGGICAPAPELAPIGGDRFIADGSARQVILPILNGVTNPLTNADPYERQGLQSAAFGNGDPLNVMGATPGEDEYSPLWDITPVVWSSSAISGGFLQRLHQDDEVRNFVNSGDLTSYALIYGPVGPPDNDIGPAPGVMGPPPILSLGIVSNCPIMLRVNAGVLPYDPSNQDGTAAEIAALTAPAPPAGNQCNGIYNGTFSGTVTVSSGQNCTFSSGAVVNGNINMKGGFLVLNGATVNGNVEIQKGDSFYIGTSAIHGNVVVQQLGFGSAQICGSSVTGSVQVQNNHVPVQIGGLATMLTPKVVNDSTTELSVSFPACAGNTIDGSVQTIGNGALTQVVNNTVTGNVQVQGDAQSTVEGNTAGGNLQVTATTGPQLTSGNTVTGNLQVMSASGATTLTGNKVGQELQCDFNANISGSGNTAHQKQGQCASF